MIIDFVLGNLEAFVQIIVGVIGFLGVILSLNASRKVNLAEFIAKYNLTFLTTPEFTNVEQKLDSCYSSYFKNYIENNSTNNSKTFINECKIIFDTDNDGNIKKEFSQNIINYLVYLESFATLIIQKQVKIKDIDDLFGYRFFIAVNNPIIQKSEILPNTQYYKGIIKVYKIWTKYYRKHKEKEPMAEFALSKSLFK